MRRVAMTHLSMRLELPGARSRRCPHQPTPSGRPCALRWPRGHTHTRWAWRPSVSRRRPVRCRAQELRSAAACTPRRLRRRVAQGAPRAFGRLCNVPLRWLCAGRFAAIQGGFLCCAPAAANLTPAAAVTAQVVRLGQHRRLDRASTCPAPPAPCMLRRRVKAEPFGWPGGQPGPGQPHGEAKSATCLQSQSKRRAMNYASSGSLPKSLTMSRDAPLARRRLLTPSCWDIFA